MKNVDFIKKYSIMFLKPARVFICLLMVVLIIFSSNFLPARFSLKTTQISSEQNELVKTKKQIKKGSGEKLVADQDGLEMYVNTDTLNLRILDTETGRNYNTISTKPSMTGVAYSPVVLTYLDQNNAVVEWNAHDFCIANGNFSIYSIKNGVRLVLNFSTGTNYVLTDYLPKQISAERYKKCWTDRLDERVKEGKITESQKRSYTTVLKSLFRLSDDKKSYVCTAKRTPIKSIMVSVVEITTILGYTRDDVISDNSEFNIDVELSKMVNATLYVDNYFDKGQMVVNIPTYAATISSGYTLQNVKLYPAFDCVSDYGNKGYIFVPDGSGMLIPLDSYDSSIPQYNRPVYDNNLFKSYATSPEYSEKLSMPVYGMYYTGSDGNTSGYCAVIESGAEVSYINVSLLGKTQEEGGPGYNSICCSADISQYSTVNIMGEYASKTAQYVSVTDPMKFDFTVRFYFVSKDAGYYKFAQLYKENLFNGKSPSYLKKPLLYVNLLGSLTVPSSFLGISYDKIITLTDYSQALQIYKELSKRSNVVLSYNWLFNSGRSNALFNKAKLVRKAGSQSELKKLIQNVSKTGEFFAEADFMRVYDASGVFDKNVNAIRGFDGDIFNLTDHRYADGTIVTAKNNNAFMLSPEYLTSEITNFVKHMSSDYPNLYLTDLGSTYYANYSKSGFVSPISANSIVNKNLNSLSKNYKLSLDSPNADKLKYCNYAIGISRQSSGYGGNRLDVPFRQLVMNGICLYTTQEINKFNNKSDYYILQAAELGSIPMFTLSASDVYKIMEYGVNDYYSVYYDEIKDYINEFICRYKKVFNAIGTTEICGHKMLDAGVFMTDYKNGRSVIVNYNDYSVNVGSDVIEPLAYKILEAK